MCWLPVLLGCGLSFSDTVGQINTNSSVANNCNSKTLLALRFVTHQFTHHLAVKTAAKRLGFSLHCLCLTFTVLPLNSNYSSSICFFHSFNLKKKLFFINNNNNSGPRIILNSYRLIDFLIFCCFVKSICPICYV